jgi:methyl-accepting chemotaxis protein
MTFEERIDRLTERHEALVQSLELLTADVKETAQTVKQHDRQIGQIVSIMESFAAGMQRLEAAQTQITRNLAETTEKLDALVHIADEWIRHRPTES